MQALGNGRDRLKVRVSALGMAITLAGAMGASAAVAAEGADMAASRLALLENSAQALELTVSDLSRDLSGFMPPQAIGVNEPNTGTPILVAQSSNAAVAVRLDQLEEQLRLINGQVEGLQFQLTQLQTLLERMQEDADARFAALEGGAPAGKTNAASQSGSGTLAGGTPQNLDLTAPGGADTGFGSGDAPLDLEAPIELGAPEGALGTLTLDDLNATGNGPEIDIGRDAGFVTDADADAQYRAGYDAVIKGDYAFAEDQFRQFIALFPDHPQAPDATNWLGEALIQRGDYDEAADILLTGFQTYPNAARSPDILMKLGIALSGTGERETACRTFSEVTRRFPGTSPAFQQRLGAEMAKAGC